MSARAFFGQALNRPVQHVHQDASTQQQNDTNMTPVIAMIAFAASAHMAHDIVHHAPNPLGAGPSC